MPLKTKKPKKETISSLVSSQISSQLFFHAFRDFSDRFYLIVFHLSVSGSKFPQLTGLFSDF